MVLTPLSKNDLLPFGLSVAMSATDVSIQKTGNTALIISNEEMKYIMKIVKVFEEWGLPIKGMSETIKNKATEQKGGFFQYY